jgi:type VI secretion system Hcp family effector
VVAVGSASPSLHESPADYYLKIEGIEGDAEDGSIAIAGLAWNTVADIGTFEVYSPRDAASGMAPGREASSGMATGRRMHKWVTISKQVDKASPVLMQKCAMGDPLADVEVWERAGGQDILRYELKDAIITSYSVSRDPADPTARPVESITFAFEKIDVAPAAAASNLNQSKSN